MIEKPFKISSTVFPDGSKLDYPVGITPENLRKVMDHVDQFEKERRDPKHVQQELPNGFSVLKIAV